MFNLTGLNMNYMRAGWQCNMSARGTYEQIYHLLRLADFALRTHDGKLFSVAVRLARGYFINEPVLAIKALETWHNAKGGQS